MNRLWSAAILGLLILGAGLLLNTNLSNSSTKISPKLVHETAIEHLWHDLHLMNTTLKYYDTKVAELHEALHNKGQELQEKYQEIQGLRDLAKEKKVDEEQNKEVRTNQAVFEDFYRWQLWGPGGGGSGNGSTLDYTNRTREILLDVVQRYRIKTFLDSPCGSMHWMHLFLEDVDKIIPNFQFMGVDVVRFLISAHRKRWSNRPNWRFQVCDISICSLPYGYELIFTRDALQHLPYHLIYSFLENVKESDAKYLLAGSYVQEKSGNKNIEAGGTFVINLLEPPFSLPAPLEIFAESPDPVPGYARKHLLLFSADDLRTKWNRTS